MTLKRSERSPEDVLYELASSYPGGVEALASRLGMSPRVLYKKLSASVSDRAPTIKEFSQIMDMGASANMENALDPLHALCWRHGGIFVQIDELDQTSDECILRGAATAMEHLGAITGSVHHALEDGHLCDNEMDKIEPKFRKFITAACGWLARIKGRAKKDSARRPFFRKDKVQA